MQGSAAAVGVWNGAPPVPSVAPWPGSERATRGSGSGRRGGASATTLGWLSVARDTGPGRPQTRYALTAEGSEALRTYVQALQRLLFY